MVGLGVNRDLVNRILNHAMGPIDETYDQHELPAREGAALQQWADKLEEIVTTDKFYASHLITAAFSIAKVT